ncbi:MAG: class I SAM-dependent methyltransferase [Rhodothermales bacterium]
MSNRSIGLTPELHAYMVGHSVREPDVLRRLREETAERDQSGMQIAPEQGAFMAMLVRMLGAKRTLEVGVFTGYSSIAVALALPSDGHITACDVSKEYTSVAKKYWREADVESMIDLRIGPAAETLGVLLDEGRSGTYDFAFVDADKPSYDTYYEHALRLVRPGGVIALDNVLRNGRVLSPAEDDVSTKAICALNDKIVADDRVDVSMVPIADGVTLARRR